MAADDTSAGHKTQPRLQTRWAWLCDLVHLCAPLGSHVLGSPAPPVPWPFLRFTSLAFSLQADLGIKFRIHSLVFQEVFSSFNMLLGFGGLKH